METNNRNPQDSSAIKTYERLVDTVDDFQQLPPEKQAEIAVFAEMFSGPLPPPETLERYESLVPGCAKTIIDNMLDESIHRRDVERKALFEGSRYAKAGLTMGFIVAILGIVLGFSVTAMVLFFAEGWSQVAGIAAGTALSGVSIVSMVKKFIDGPEIQKEDESPSMSDTKEIDNAE